MSNIKPPSQLLGKQLPGIWEEVGGRETSDYRGRSVVNPIFLNPDCTLVSPKEFSLIPGPTSCQLNKDFQDETLDLKNLEKFPDDCKEPGLSVSKWFPFFINIPLVWFPEEVRIVLNFNATSDML